VLELKAEASGASEIAKALKMGRARFIVPWRRHPIEPPDMSEENHTPVAQSTIRHGNAKLPQSRASVVIAGGRQVGRQVFN
jgi:hypothetical protein